MVATAALPSGSAVASAKKSAAKTAGAVKKPRAKPTHPRTADMVDAAIAALKEKGGSSLQAIKKYIAATYKVDGEKLSPFIKKYLKSAVVGKKLVQTKGKGASGSFRLSLGDAKSMKATGALVKKTAARKPAMPAKKKTVAAKKASPKKKVLKTLAARPPKPKVSKAKTAAKKPVAKPARKAVGSKVKKSPARKLTAKK